MQIVQLPAIRIIHLGDVCYNFERALRAFLTSRGRLERVGPTETKHKKQTNQAEQRSQLLKTQRRTVKSAVPADGPHASIWVHSPTVLFDSMPTSGAPWRLQARNTAGISRRSVKVMYF